MNFFGGCCQLFFRYPISILYIDIKMVIIYALFDQYGMHYYMNMIYLFQDREIRSDDMT